MSTYYEKTIVDNGQKLSVLRSRNKLFIVSEILTFVLFIAAVILFANGTEQNLMGIFAILMIAVYLGIRRLDSKTDKEIHRLEDVLSVCKKEMNFLQGKFNEFDDGERYVDPKHPFTLDLDIFGKNSLYQRVCRAVTTGGADALADAFRLANGFHDERLAAIKTLSEDTELQTEFKRWGQRGVADTNAVRKAFAKMQNISLPWWAKSKVVRIVSWIYMVVFLCLLVACIVIQQHLLTMVWWCIINFFVIYIICNKSMKSMTDAVGGLIKQLGLYVQLVKIIENHEVDEPVLNGLKNQVKGASESLQKLDDILQKLESRGNILGLFIFDMLFLWDFRILSSFANWQKQYSNSFDRWIDTVSEYDMLMSMATFAYNERGLTTDAEVFDSDRVVYEAKGLFHPFLGKKAVRNDFSIVDRNFYIITGANMAGKSTFLRSLGINYILAMNGMPVFADKFTVGRFNLFTSMRTTDDLTHGISYFNAELLRLKQILDSISNPSTSSIDTTHDLNNSQGNSISILSKEGCGGSLGEYPTLIILDEILKGTNSEDKLSGSRMFLEYVSKKNVTGVIATHDLKLSAMSDEQPDRFHNFCFEIALGTDVTYSYKITPGVARNQNATFLLKKLLK